MFERQGQLTVWLPTTFIHHFPTLSQRKGEKEVVGEEGKVKKGEGEVAHLVCLTIWSINIHSARFSRVGPQTLGLARARNGGKVEVWPSIWPPSTCHYLFCKFPFNFQRSFQLVCSSPKRLSHSKKPNCLWKAILWLHLSCFVQLFAGLQVHRKGGARQEEGGGEELSSALWFNRRTGSTPDIQCF